MILSQTAIYALRGLAVLTHLPPGEKLSASALSEQTAVPREYLSKVMRQLAHAGIISAVRGNGGGFSLNRPASKIRIADVLKAVDMRLDLGKCAFSTGNCNVQSPCSLHSIWSTLQKQVGDWANDTFLADIDGPAHS